MNTQLLLQWLELSAPDWPPDDRTLLGLPAGAVDPALAEQNALARMELLRPHQLKHPELVTEGMNRLAQALLALIDVSAAVDPPPAAHRPGRADREPDPIPAPLAWEAVDLAPASPSPEITPSALEVLEAEVLAAVPSPRLSETAEATPPPAGLRAAAVPRLDPPAGIRYIPANRRKAYRQLVELRKLLRAWARFGPVLGIPGETLASAESVYILLSALDEYRGLLKQRPRLRQRVARVCAHAVLCHPQPLAVLRELLPDQRRRLASDWSQAAARWQAEYEIMRRGLRASVPRNRLERGRRELIAAFTMNPEWILVFLTLVALLFGIVRWSVRSP